MFAKSSFISLVKLNILKAIFELFIFTFFGSTMFLFVVSVSVSLPLCCPSSDFGYFLVIHCLSFWFPQKRAWESGASSLFKRNLKKHRPRSDKGDLGKQEKPKRREPSGTAQFTQDLWEACRTLSELSAKGFPSPLAECWPSECLLPPTFGLCLPLDQRSSLGFRDRPGMQSREDMPLRLDCSVCVQTRVKLYKADAAESKRWHQGSAACTCTWKRSPVCILGCDSSWQSKLSAEVTWHSNLEQWHQPQDFSLSIWLGREVRAAHWLPSFWSASFFFSPQIILIPTFRNKYK